MKGVKGMLTTKKKHRPTSEASAAMRASVFRLTGIRLEAKDVEAMNPDEAGGRPLT